MQKLALAGSTSDKSPGVISCDLILAYQRKVDKVSTCCEFP